MTYMKAVPVRDAATVVLVRDGQAAPQTLMMRRSDKAVFGPGAYVFPGGAVDGADGAGELAQRCTGRSDANASHALGIAKGGLAFWVAAVRECFEEAGVLIATGPDGSTLPQDDPQWQRELAAQRRALNAGARDFASICNEFDVYLPLDRIHYFSHWITPPGLPRRFSTRFFAAEMPAGVQAAVDGSEITTCEWLAADQALSRGADGAMPLMPPTLAQLRLLGESSSSRAFVAAVAGMSDVEAVTPGAVPEKVRRQFMLAGEHGA